jgi:hypothetical protein
LALISAANSSGGGRNQARRQRGDAVARAAGERKERGKRGGAAGPFVRCHLVGFDQVGQRR